MGETNDLPKKLRAMMDNDKYKAACARYRQLAGIFKPSDAECREADDLARDIAVHVAIDNATQAEPQPVAVPQCAKDWAKRQRNGQQEWHWLLSDDTAETVAWIESLDRPATLQATTSDAETITALRAELEIARGRIAELEAKPQPMTVTPLALFMADKTMTFALECLRLGRPLKAEEMAELVKQTTVAAIAAAARIEGGNAMKFRVEYVEINPSGEIIKVEAATAADAIRIAPDIVGHRIVSAEQIGCDEADDVQYAELIATCESCGYRICSGDPYFTTLEDNVTLCEKCLVEQEGSRR